MLPGRTKRAIGEIPSDQITGRAFLATTSHLRTRQRGWAVDGRDGIGDGRFRWFIATAAIVDQY